MGYIFPQVILYQVDRLKNGNAESSSIMFKGQVELLTVQGVYNTKIFSLDNQYLYLCWLLKMEGRSKRSWLKIGHLAIRQGFPFPVIRFLKHVANTSRTTRQKAACDRIQAFVSSTLLQHFQFTFHVPQKVAYHRIDKRELVTDYIPWTTLRTTEYTMTETGLTTECMI